MANYNCPGQTVITGEAGAVNAASERLKELGAKRCVPLKVSGPFHSPMLKGAGEDVYKRQVLNMKPVRDDIVRKFLMEDMQIPDYKANVCVAFARGNIGRAKLLASSEDFDNVKEEAVTLLKYIHDMEISEIVAAIKKISEYKLDVTDYLDILSIWYRDVLLFKATNDANHLIFKEEIKYIRKEADQKSYEGIEIILDSLEKAKSRLSANVNFDLTMELLFLTMK